MTINRLLADIIIEEAGKSQSKYYDFMQGLRLLKRRIQKDHEAELCLVNYLYPKKRAKKK